MGSFMDKNNSIKSWIFVTGVIRSGTTFVGMNLSIPKEVDYIHEPFNPQCGIEGMDRWYPYINPNVESQQMQCYHSQIKKIFDYDIKLKTFIPKKDPINRKIIKKIIGSRGPYYLRLAKMNPFHTTAIIKDPIGNLLTEYLYVKFGVKPVIIMKHPISFVASLRRVNWTPNLNEINDQMELVSDFFDDERHKILCEYNDPLRAAAAYWRAVHKVFLAQLSKYPSWISITHEELSENPIKIFKMLYDDLGIPWSKRVEDKIIKQTQKSSSPQAKKGIVQDFNRKSADIFKTRVNELSLDERRIVFELVQDVALKIYPRSSFYLD